MTLEHSPNGKRGFYASFTLSGTQAGLILAAAVFVPIAQLPEDQLLAWGWRVPFWLSVIVIAVGFYVRRNLAESPAFEDEKQRHVVPRTPLSIVIREYPMDIVRVVFMCLVSTVSTIFGVYALSFAVNTVHIERSTMLWLIIVTSLFHMILIPYWARLSDRIGRRPVYICGTLASGTLMYPFLWAAGSANLTLIYVFGILMIGMTYSAQSGTWPVYFGELFDTRVRLSGMAIGTQIGFALGGFAPAVGQAIQGQGTSGWPPVAFLTIGVCLIAAIAAILSRETYNLPIQALGRSRGPTPADVEIIPGTKITPPEVAHLR
jgi:MFS family permease